MAINDNYIYVADTTNNKVHYFDSSYNLLGSWTSSSPEKLFVDTTGSVYVNDISANQVKKFNYTGLSILNFGTGTGSGDGGFDVVTGMNLAANGDLYVCDQGNNRVQIFNDSASYLSQYGVVGTGNGQFNGPQTVLSDANGNTYVVDKYNHRVQKFDSSNTFVKAWGTNGTGNTQFQYPQGGCIDINNNIYIADKNNNRVVKYDTNGNYKAVFGELGSGDGQLHYPYSCSVDPSGNLLVADRLNNRIVVFDSSTNFIANFSGTGFNNPSDVFYKTVAGLYFIPTAYNGQLERRMPIGSFAPQGNGDAGTIMGGQGSRLNSPRNIHADQFMNDILR